MLDALKAALEATGYPFAHYGWSRAPEGAYGVYAEDGSADQFADDGHAERSLTGTVDLFTRDDGDIPRETIEAALATVPFCAWYLGSVQFESDTGYVHYEWVFEVV